MAGMRAAPPLSLYVHLPWCRSKCPYCDFNSHALRGAVPDVQYTDALIADLEQDLGLVERCPRPLESVFFGGGTPSLFSPPQVERLLQVVHHRFGGAGEVTLEANPGSVDPASLAGYREAGVNRLSLGAQSFNKQHLAALGRIHGPEETELAVRWAREAGFSNLNLDLMYGLPGQSREQAEADIARAVELAPSHVSYYQLTIEPNTQFFHQPPTLPDEDCIWEMQVRAQKLLKAAGYGQYEVSAYAQPGARCRHNLNYWRYGDYLGIGAGAHGKTTDPAAGRIWRHRKPAHPKEYMSTAAAGGGQVLHQEVIAGERPFEFMLNALRLRQGFEEDLFESRTGLTVGYLAGPAQRARELGLLVDHDGVWRATDRGFRFLNDLQALFLPDRLQATSIGAKH